MADESLDAIARTDALLDAIAGERRFVSNDPDEAALFGLLEAWRDEIRSRPVDDVLTEQQAVVALNRGKTEPVPVGRRPRRGLAVVASAAAAVLAIGGFGAVVAGSGPGDALYGLHTMLFGEEQAVRDDRVALVAKTEMQQVQQLIDQGEWQQAQEKLQAVSTQVQSVEDVGIKTDLVRQWNDLSFKVGVEDAAAPLPPMLPGQPMPSVAPGVTLLPLPPAPALESLGTEMLKVKELVDQGQWQQAQEMLQPLGAQVESVGDVRTMTDFVRQWNELGFQIGEENATAVLPSLAPGEPMPVLPHGITLLELPPAPPVATTTTTAPGTTDTSATTGAETTAPTTPTSGTSQEQTPPTTPTSVTSPEPATPTPTSSAAPAPATTPPVTSNPAGTVTTTVPPAAPPTSVPAATATPQAPASTTNAPTVRATTEVAETTAPAVETAEQLTPSQAPATTRAATTSSAAPAPTTQAQVAESTSAPARATTTTTEAPAAQEPVSQAPATADAPTQRQVPAVTTTVVPDSGD